jgi:hypothetical protein
MTFGRMNNMRRRSVRPDLSFHRAKRRRGAEKLSLLEDTKLLAGPEAARRGIVAAVRRWLGGR